jgi:hypothetical protein
MNLRPEGNLLANWAGGGGVIEGGGPPQLATYLAYVIPAVIGSYVIFSIMITLFVRRGIIQL